MSNVWEAMKKHEAEVAAKAATADGPPAEHATDDSDGASLVDIELVTEPETKAAPEREWVARAPRPRRAAGPARSNVEIDREANFDAMIVAHHDRGGGITEEYRSLRTSILATCANGKFSCIVTSALAGEGKTVTCLNLAVVLAEQAERRTIVVDGDMRRATAGKLIHAPAGPGFADLLRGKAEISEAIQPTAYPNLFFIPAARTDHHELGELLGRSEREVVFADLRREFDHIIVDTPPLCVASDAAILGQSAGEAMLVVRMNKTPAATVERAIRLLRAANVDLAGMILTHRKHSRSSYYGYGYGYGYRYS